MSKSYVENVEDVFELCVAAVEATLFEHQCLWKEYHKTNIWEQNLSGYCPTVAVLDDMPICVSIQNAKINGHRVLFYHATSVVVDHRIIESWIKSKINHNIRLTDADSFYAVLLRIAELNKK